MTLPLLLLLPVVLGILVAGAFARRQGLQRMAAAVRERDRAIAHGAVARLQHPVVDLSRCLGCGTCVRACPEEGVLELVHGQAMVVAGARCVGHGACERSCPVGAITITLGDTTARDDIPALDGELQAIGQDGLYLAGEVTAHALIKNAVEQGKAVAAAAARRVAATTTIADDDTLDLCIVGAGPAGLACALQARSLGLRFLVLEQERSLGGTVAKYPRQKLVLTQPVELPLGGSLDRTSYTKEELVELWQQLAADHELPIRTGEELRAIQRAPDRSLRVVTSTGTVMARNVCLALGRRGVPQRLDVDGEDLPKVAYSLLDAASYEHRRIAVVGAGDSAVEAALALAEQEGNTVTLIARGSSFARVRTRNVERLDAARAEGRIDVRTGTRVVAITATHIAICTTTPDGERTQHLDNDDVFVLVGSRPPIDLLRAAGVSFDPALRAPAATVVEQGTGVLPALVGSAALALAAAVFVLWNRDYYALDAAERATHELHAWLRPGMGLGLVLGIAATALLLLNLLYLLRRRDVRPFHLGSLRGWMTLHVVTGITAFVAALLHAAMQPRATVGGDALWLLLGLVITGAIGRYFYAALPRAANGRELELGELKLRLAEVEADATVGEREFAGRARTRLQAGLDQEQWGSSFATRALALLTGGLRTRRLLHRLEEEGRAAGIDDARLQPLLALAAQAHALARRIAHFEELRGILATWRFLHRWLALVLVALLALHIVHALSFATIGFGGAG